MKQWDVFISHATEDKADVVLPLAELLRAKGLKVWLDRTEIKVGDSLRGKIEDGLTRSRFGVVVLSKSFFAKRWGKMELDGLTALEEDGHKVILPVWHGIGKVEVTQNAPMLAGLLALRTIDGLETVANELAAVVLDPESGSPSAVPPSFGRRLANLVERGASANEMFDFMHKHVGMVKLASGRQPYPEVLGIRAADIDYRGFACWRDDEPDKGLTLVIAGPTRNPLFDEKQDPLKEMNTSIQSAISIQRCIIAGLAKTKDGRVLKPSRIVCRIFAGRQAFMSTDDMLAREELKGMDVQLRTYDLLIQTVSVLFP